MARAEWILPASFSCPILREVMQDPVVLSDGHSYERSAITRWLEDHDSSPLTRSVLSCKDIIPNHTLRHAITEYFEIYLQNLRTDILANRDTCSEEAKADQARSLVQATISRYGDTHEHAVWHVMAEARVLLQAPFAGVFLIDRELGVLKGALNEKARIGELSMESISGRVARTGEAELVLDVAKDPSYCSSPADKAGITMRDYMAAPLKDEQGNIHGVVVLFHTIHEDGIFTMADLHFLQLFAAETFAVCHSYAEYLGLSLGTDRVSMTPSDDPVVHSCSESELGDGKQMRARIDTPEWWPDAWETSSCKSGSVTSKISQDKNGSCGATSSSIPCIVEQGGLESTADASLGEGAQACSKRESGRTRQRRAKAKRKQGEPADFACMAQFCEM